MRRIFPVLYIILLSIFGISFLFRKNLPEQTEILAELKREPIQAANTSLSPSEFTYRDKMHEVKPVADYELWGLVVSVNNIGAWYNVYHDKDSVNLKDICVIWGDNLTSDAYKEVKYKSGEWTCYYSWWGQLSGPFLGNKLSNNHLFSDQETIRNTIKKMEIGDQIHIKGALAEYSEKGKNTWRKSSTSRDDQGNGACETIFVKEAQILKKQSPDWHNINKISKYALLLLICTNITFFLYKTFKKSKTILNS